jgi:hypothetical protein
MPLLPIDKRNINIEPKPNIKINVTIKITCNMNAQQPHADYSNEFAIDLTLICFLF